MTWNYRILKHDDKTLKELIYCIHEVYYDKNGTIESYTLNPISPQGESSIELINDIAQMLIDSKKYTPISKNKLDEIFNYHHFEAE